jgi:hypothetical protein
MRAHPSGTRGEGVWNRAGVAPVLEGWGLCGAPLSVGRVWRMRNLVVRLRLLRAAFAADREGRAGHRRLECVLMIDEKGHPLRWVRT